MANIELVINIPEEEYKRVIDGKWEGNDLADYIKDGTPLPKGHGRIIVLSEDVLKKNQINVDFSPRKWIGEVGLEKATVAIIEADKENDYYENDDYYRGAQEEY